MPALARPTVHSAPADGEARPERSADSKARPERSADALGRPALSPGLGGGHSCETASQRGPGGAGRQQQEARVEGRGRQCWGCPVPRRPLGPPRDVSFYFTLCSSLILG